MPTRIGVLSDTHGLLRPHALTLLLGSDLIIHAGDIGPAHILDDLARIAPVTAVRGNTDNAPWTASLPAAQTVRAGAARLHVVHDIADLDSDLARSGLHAVIYGHSHKPGIAWRDGVLFLNPGSAGPRRFSLPVTLALLSVDDRGALSAEVVPISLER